MRNVWSVEKNRLKNVSFPEKLNVNDEEVKLFKKQLDEFKKYESYEEDDAITENNHKERTDRILKFNPNEIDSQEQRLINTQRICIDGFNEMLYIINNILQKSGYEKGNDFDITKIIPTAEKHLNNYGVFIPFDQELNIKKIEKLCKDQNFLKSPPNTALFWNDCGLNDFFNINDKFWEPYKNGYNNIITDTQREKHNVGNSIRLSGEQSSRIVAKEYGLETLRNFVRLSDSGNIIGVPDKNTVEKSKQQRKEEIQKDMDNCWLLLSGTYAKRASGTVFHMTGGDPKSHGNPDGHDTYWERIELPILMENKNVTEIVEFSVKDRERAKSKIFPNGLRRDKLKEFNDYLSQHNQNTIEENQTFKVEYNSDGICNIITDKTRIIDTSKTEMKIKEFIDNDFQKQNETINDKGRGKNETGRNKNCRD